jgi:exosortase A-associated hydrolase 1
MIDRSWCAPDASERFVGFDCGSERCLGVLSMPRNPVRALGVVIVVGGPQYRVGSHRQFVHLARRLAAAGIPALRFDYRGMGDSDGDLRSFETIDDDLRRSIDVLGAESGVARCALWGLCDGATAALSYAPSDPRVVGVVAANPWVRTESVEAAARLRHYYRRRLFAGDWWDKVRSGRFQVRVAMREVVAAVRSARAMPRRSRESFLAKLDRGWASFGGRVLVILSGQDHTAAEFETWINVEHGRAARFAGPRTTVLRLPDADHTFSTRKSAVEVADRTAEWLDILAAA